MARSFGQLVVLMAGLMSGGILLATSYRAITLLLPESWSRPWIAAHAVNAILALFVAINFSRVKTWDPVLKDPTPQPKLYALGGLIFGASLLGALMSRSFGGAPASRFQMESLAWVLIVPLAEEWVFRVGTGSVLRKQLGIWKGAYLSALFFGWMHSSPTLTRVLDLKTGIPLGPVLLAFCCEWIYAKGGKIGPAVGFHMACNGTAVIFAALDERWLYWLGFLYM